MSSKRNQTIAIARFLMYKYGLNQQLEGMTDEEYLAHPIALPDRRRNFLPVIRILSSFRPCSQSEKNW